MLRLQGYLLDVALARCRLKAEWKISYETKTQRQAADMRINDLILNNPEVIEGVEVAAQCQDKGEEEDAQEGVTARQGADDLEFKQEIIENNAKEDRSSVLNYAWEPRIAA